MDDREKIAYLQELAESHFTDGNLSAAISAWQQVLVVDKGNEAAQRGILMAQARLGGSRAAAAEGPFGPDAGAAGPFDGDATLMFATPGAQAGGGGGADIEQTLVVPAGVATPSDEGSGFDADSTIVFGPGQESAAPAVPTFDANRTMAFGSVPFGQPPAPPPSPPAGGFDADRTMAFSAGQAPAAGGFDFGLAPPAPPPAWSPGAASDESDRTLLTPEAPGAPASQLVPDDITMLSDDARGSAPPAPPRPVAPPPMAPPPPAGNKQLEDFDLPAGGLEMAGPLPSLPDLPSFGAPPLSPPPPAATKPGPAKDAGFSFELPPPPSSGGSAFDLPELPSVGLPPPPPPPAPPPPPPQRKPAASANFGEVDPGEIEGLAVPVVTPQTQSEGEDEHAGESQAVREARLKEEYAKQFGRTPVSGSAPLPVPLPASRGPNMVALGLVVGVFVAAMVGIYFVWQWRSRPAPPPPPPVATKIEKTPEQYRAEYMESVAGAKAALGKHAFDDAVKEVAKGYETAKAAGLAATPELDLVRQSIQFEQAWQAKFDRALRDFCMENYADARSLFQELQQARPSDPRPGEYIARLWYNAGVLQLQMKQPWEAVYYFEQVLALTPNDAEAKRQLALAGRFRPGDNLDANYSFMVDSLELRMTGCTQQ